MKNEIKLSDLMKYRSVWMGFAILWTIIYHSSIPLYFKSLSIIQSFGYGGADIFIFASGIGCYFSLSHNSVKQFFKNRITKIYPTWVTFIFIYFLFISLSTRYPFSIKEILGNLFFTAYLDQQKYNFNWYIHGLIFFYSVAVCIFDIIKTSKKPTALIIIIISLFISFSVWDNTTLIIIAARIPLFIVGMLFTKYAKENASVSIIKLTIFAFGCLSLGILILYIFNLFFDSYLWCYGLYWYPFILIAPSLCLLISILCKSFESLTIHPIKYILEELGNSSFSIYLWHAFYLIYLMPYWNTKNIISDSNRNKLPILFLICLLCCIFSSIKKRMKEQYKNGKS